MKWTVTIEEDKETGELLLPFPPDLLSQMGWIEGTELFWQDQKDGTYILKYKTGNHCWRMWSSCVFTWDAQVVPCCFDKDAKHSFGTISEKSFQDIWNSKKYHEFRQAILSNRKEIDICSNCSEGTKVWN